MINRDIGILSYGLYFPEEVETAREIAEKSGLPLGAVEALGIERKPLPTAEDQPVTMAAKAVGNALERGGLDPAMIDVVIWAGEEYKDYVAQTAAIRLQEESGCKNAWAFDLVGQGVTLILGLRVARDIMLSDGEISTVLIAGGTRNIDLVDYRNPHTQFLLPCSASGGAVILKRGHPKNLLLSAAFTSHPEMADEIYVPGGGTEHPYTPENLQSPIMYFQAKNPERLVSYLDTRFPAALVETARIALGGRKPDYVALRHLSPHQRAQVLAGLSAKNSVELNRWGHHGPVDTLISLHLGLQEGSIREGDTVTLLSAGFGFHYATAVVGWG